MKKRAGKKRHRIPPQCCCRTIYISALHCVKSAPHSINPHRITPDPHLTAPVCHNPHQIRTSQNGPAPTRSRRECHTLQSGLKVKFGNREIFYFNLKYYDHFDTMQSQHEVADEEIERSIPRDSSKLSASVTCMLTCWVHSTDDAAKSEKYCKYKNTRFQIPVKSFFCVIIYYCRIYLS